MVWPCHQKASEMVSQTVFASKDKSKEACVIDLKQNDTNEEDLTKITKARTRSQEWWRIVGAMALSCAASHSFRKSGYREQGKRLIYSMIIQKVQQTYQALVM